MYSLRQLASYPCCVSAALHYIKHSLCLFLQQTVSDPRHNGCYVTDRRHREKALNAAETPHKASVAS